MDEVKNFFFANFQILGPLGCQGWVVIPQNVKKSKNHCTLMTSGIGKGGICICNVNWTVVLGSLFKDIFLIKPELFVLPGGYTIGAKPTWMARVSSLVMSSVQNPN